MSPIKPNKALPLAELKQITSPIINTNKRSREKLSRLDKIALFITGRVGTMGFFFTIFIWTVSWLSWNVLAPISLRFDPFPAFVMWLFISNMIQIFLMPLIMVGQNLQGRHAEIRAESDFQVNIKSEREIETILEHLEYQNQLILGIVEQLESESDTK